MDKCGIYLIRNKINGKVYIGQSINIERRIGDHFSRRSGTDLHKDIQQYGKDNFEIEVLEECKVEDLNKRERFYIEKYESFGEKGYNLNTGGNSNPNFTEERKQNISKACKGRVSPNKGKPMSEAQRQKISETLKRKNANRTIEVWNKGLTKDTDVRVKRIAENASHPKSFVPKRGPQTEETKQKISNSLKGNKLSEETKQKMSLAHKGKKYKKRAKND